MLSIADLLIHPPLQNLVYPQFSEVGLHVWVLRLDAMHAILSGNKWLKLAPWLDTASAQQSVGIVAHGGPWSNFLHATAYACQQVGLAFTALVQAPPHTSTATLADIVAWGGQLVFEPAFNAQRQQHWGQWAAQNGHLYIPMGGDGPEGVQGVAKAFNNWPHLQNFSQVWCALGTGTTCLGIAASKLAFGQLVGVNVGLNQRHYLSLLATMAQQYPHRQFKILDHPNLGRFGKMPAYLPPLMNNWAETHHLHTDAVYTAKAFYLLQQMAEAGSFEAGTRLLLIHTGGLQGNRSLPPGSLSYSWPAS
ncbi:MAG: pyridoxal-phosphate dependent enzyme [Bacteroidetes bacterium]|nr:MAG: pyridoxal-phosphate dependent enzyme [Bacteroidota bacterium]